MPSFTHNKLIETITSLDNIPKDTAQFSEWIKAGPHLNFLQDDSLTEEIVVYASGGNMFINSVVVPNSKLELIDQDDLLLWNCSLSENIAGYVYGGGRPDMRIERGGYKHTGSKALDDAMGLVFDRTFEGWPDDERQYFELHQEYTHLADIHWRPEHRSYCRFDQHGDLEHVVGITTRESSQDKIAAVSFAWAPLEKYLVVSNSSLVRMFDFTLFRRGTIPNWTDRPETKAQISDELFYRQKILEGIAAYTRGVQIVRPRRPQAVIEQDIKDSWGGGSNKQYASFIAHDWRNNKITEISTNPVATTNDFQARENNRPFELSPAFFRPEVLSKYKTDREKYTIDERDVYCRASWHLRGYDVNEAGQVHAYICDLRNIPYSEQLHWCSFNEAPKATISERALANDFKGEWVVYTSSFRELLSTAHRWDKEKKPWWKLRDPALLQRASIPLTASRDEWADSFMDLSKLIVESFDLSFIRAKLKELGLTYQDNEKSILLLERFCEKKKDSSLPDGLLGLRTIQLIRSKVKGHAENSEAKQIVKEALAKHETFSKHFTHICNLAVADLKTIEDAMQPIRIKPSDYPG